MTTEESRQYILVRYGEIGVKGKNRSIFERQLVRNIRRALRGLPEVEVRREWGHLTVTLPEDAPLTVAVDRLQQVFGIVYFAPATSVENDLEAIKRAAWEVLRPLTFTSFKVDTKRSYKDFPLKSPEVNAEVGAYLQQHSQAEVDLTAPQVTCYLEISPQRTYIHTQRIPGPGGLPVGVSERAVSLLSAGIDSPVASYLMLKRGVEVVFVHFHSYPYTDRASQENALELVKILTQYQYRSRLYFVPLAEIQQRVVALTPPAYRVLLYRRAMFRLADRLAEREKAAALVTGESVGQVASQTLSNLRVTSEVATRPILRPLAGFDKQEIIAQARALGTYEISIEPYEDCCSLFVPQHPATRAKRETVREWEAELAWEPLLEEALAQTEEVVVEFAGSASGWAEGMRVHRRSAG
ncbi:MAG TPA: tRNA 4-thiouridine(8) synthase ThiI [Armatimonadetes bacterium]|nr:tRNA 4-thiouridine(8) synthase ThiI [Armatimonadota bacterium]